MRLSEFFGLDPEIFPFKACSEAQLDPGAWRVGAEVAVLGNGDGYFLQYDDEVCPVEPILNQKLVQMMVVNGNALWVLRGLKSSEFVLQATQPAIQISMDLQIGVDENITDFLVKKGEISYARQGEALKWMTEEFLLSDNEDSVRAFVAHYEQGNEGDFQFIGRKWCAVLSRSKRDAPCVKRVHRLNGQEFVPSLLEGKIAFIDASVAAQALDPVSLNLLDQALRDHGSYLDLWESYSQLEWSRALSNATKLSFLRYSSAAQIEESEFVDWQFNPQDSAQFRSFTDVWRTLDFDEGWEFEVSKKIPEYLNTSHGDVDSDIDVETRGARGKMRLVNGTVVVRFEPDFKGEIPKEGVIYASLDGHRTVQNRRQKAKNSIYRGRRMPQLKYIVEGVPLPAQSTRLRTKGLTPYAREMFPGRRPTDQQERAILAALSTTDLAVIVGPPGTGKTQVIAALERCLVGEFKDQPLQHQILVSSFQHDAVENALTRTDVYGLPAVKVGQRRRKGEEGGGDSVRSWCNAKISYVEEQLQLKEKADPLVPLLRNLRKEIAFLRVAFITVQERFNRLKVVDNLLKEISLNNLRLVPDLRDDWERFYSKIDSCQPFVDNINQNKKLVRLVRALRTSPVEFDDDGPERALHCLLALKRAKSSFSVNDLDILSKASEMAPPANLEMLKILRGLKDRLLGQLIPDYRPPKVKNLIEPSCIALLNRIDQSLAVPIRSSRRGVAAVLADYCDALIHEPKRIHDAASKYASIVGATCQQAAGRDMESLKNITDLNEGDGIEFDTVIIDEAARANPLDLFIPMAMARRRVILVGDHLQLPHLLDPEIESELGENLNLQEMQKVAMRQSLFERLVQQLRKDENPSYPRVIMLDTQYRMHPLLGDFISKNFYERVGEKPLKSGRKAEDFIHSLPGYNGKVAAWIDVPHAAGGEKYHSGSRRRRVEARRIALEVSRLMEAAPHLSFGVIAFYSAQRDLILQELKTLNIAEDCDHGIRIRAQFRENNGVERLRVGTVDAFQGKEFDVVLLSVVRSAPDKLPAGSNEKSWNSRYGFLRLANRMNVAMSRQRCLLIAVGDALLAEDPAAALAVPALQDFFNLCRGPHGTTIR